ncbi:hypothetical protein K2173_023243 [Erythroxylum novogranatense]|uniref:Uncharacterized protein n=1 Tax=Erythroxylum novogranatense TaxID=1862640 RepID=A0AAV8T9X3_9ROSI|nr:hypothetical protein K2173_023243 [Erythroxylum novogranatense]
MARAIYGRCNLGARFRDRKDVLCILCFKWLKTNSLNTSALLLVFVGKHGSQFTKQNHKATSLFQTGRFCSSVTDHSKASFLGFGAK